MPAYGPRSAESLDKHLPALVVWKIHVLHGAQARLAPRGSRLICPFAIYAGFVDMARNARDRKKPERRAATVGRKIPQRRKKA